MENDLQKLWQEIEFLKARNRRVEAAKAWETSWTRRIIVALLTYILVVIFMTMAQFQQPFLEALVPTVAYLLSVSSVNFIKKWWLKRYAHEKTCP